ncbi:MAG TPA: hypothetical protein VGC32_12310 [Solirubrobacterales bacterium]
MRRASTVAKHRRSLDRLRGAAEAVAFQVLAFVLSMCLLVGLLALLGYAPDSILRALWKGSAETSIALSQSLSQSVPLMLSAVAVWFAFQVGMFNVGADGQLQVGGTAAVAVAVAMPGQAPAILTIVLSLLAGALAGAAFAGIAGALRAFRGANEVISTIMLNFVALILVNILISGALRAPTAKFSPQTEYVPTGAELGGILQGSGIPLIAVIAVAISFVTIAAVRVTRGGLRLRAIGRNPDAAVHAGIRVDCSRFLAFTFSGALAGLGGALVILGYRHYIAPGWAPQWGLLGIAIGFLAVRTPFMIPLWAIILGMLGAAGPALKAGASVPDSVTTLMQVLPLIVLFLLYAAARAWRARAARSRASERTSDPLPVGT